MVPREYKSSEHHYNSLQKRKRSAVSLADPMDVLKKQAGPLEVSSEFTRCLTPDEIVNLNQHRSITSPSERMRLFSFTRRHLKLPFSKSKGKRDKDLRDRLVSPDKEAAGGGPASGANTPTKHHQQQLHHRRASPTAAKSAHFVDRAEGKACMCCVYVL